MKTILLALALALMSHASAQVVTTTSGFTIKFWSGEPSAVRAYTTPNDTAKDSVIYVKPFYYDLAGRNFQYGMNVVTMCDTFNLKLVLEASIDSTNWTPLDSITVTPQIVGQYKGIYDATLKPYFYWRLRFPVPNTKLRGDTNGGKFQFFIATNLQRRP